MDRTTPGRSATEVKSPTPVPAGPLPAQEAVPVYDLGLLELINIFLRHWKLLITVPLVFGILAAMLSLLLPPTFTASTAFVPEAGSQTGGLPAQLTGLAGQFGISLGSEAAQSPQFYASVLRSREILDRVLTSPYPDPRFTGTGSDSTTLLRLLDVEGRTYADSLHNAREELDNLMSTAVDNQTSIVTLRVDSRYPAVAAAAANRFVQALNQFNTQTRQFRARERRRFIEARVVEAQNDLEEAEDAIERFYERNRMWDQSPQLVSQHDRLQRQVQIRQEVFLTLRREYETARISEVNDTPMITVIDAATPPQQRSKPRRTLLVAAVLIISGMLTALTAFARDYLQRVQEQDLHPYREFRSLIARMRAEIAGAFRRPR